MSTPMTVATNFETEPVTHAAGARQARTEQTAE
jgi:hypothetical protein